MARNVVISGGGTGIGLAAAHAFAADGDRVLLLGRRREVLEKAGVPGALTYAGDLSEPEVVRGVGQFVAEEFGTVDVLVHSAGGNGAWNPRARAAMRWTPSRTTGPSTSAATP
jgi:3-oxoacyl-[acyl-carrier protein] reductase